MNPTPGSIWRHYKGGHYRVLAVARTEADPAEVVVVYQALYGDFTVWTRPKDKWFERVNIKPGTVGEARFELLPACVL